MIPEILPRTLKIERLHQGSALFFQARKSIMPSASFKLLFYVRLFFGVFFFLEGLVFLVIIHLTISSRCKINYEQFMLSCFRFASLMAQL